MISRRFLVLACASVITGILLFSSQEASAKVKQRRHHNQTTEESASQLDFQTFKESGHVLTDEDGIFNDTMYERSFEGSPSKYNESSFVKSFLSVDKERNNSSHERNVTSGNETSSSMTAKHQGSVPSFETHNQQGEIIKGSEGHLYNRTIYDIHYQGNKTHFSQNGFVRNYASGEKNTTNQHESSQRGNETFRSGNDTAANQTHGGNQTAPNKAKTEQNGGGGGAEKKDQEGKGEGGKGGGGVEGEQKSGEAQAQTKAAPSLKDFNGLYIVVVALLAAWVIDIRS